MSILQVGSSYVCTLVLAYEHFSMLTNTQKYRMNASAPRLGKSAEQIMKLMNCQYFVQYSF